MKIIYQLKKCLLVCTILILFFGYNLNFPINAFSYDTNEQMTKAFKDVPTNHWAHNDIAWGYQMGLIQGYTDGTFRPNDPLTEAQFVAILARFYEDYKEIEVKDKNHWADGVYLSLSNFKVPLNGIDNIRIRNAPIERGEMAKAIAYTRGQKSDLNFAIDWMFAEDITQGTTTTGTNFERFGVHDHLTRAQAAAFFHRLYQLGHNQVADQVKNSKKQKVGDITLRFGHKTYGLRTQEHYDKVMDFIDDVIKDLDNLPLGHDDYNNYIYDLLFYGEPQTEYPNRDQYFDTPLSETYYTELVQELKKHMLIPLYNAGIEQDQIIEIHKLLNLVHHQLPYEIVHIMSLDENRAFFYDMSKPFDNQVTFTYHQLITALFDALKYNTMILSVKDEFIVGNYEKYNTMVLIEVNGNWIKANDPSLEIIDVEQVLREQKAFVHTQPTYGPPFKQQEWFLNLQ